MGLFKILKILCRRKAHTRSNKQQIAKSFAIFGLVFVFVVSSVTSSGLGGIFLQEVHAVTTPGGGGSGSSCSFTPAKWVAGTDKNFCVVSTYSVDQQVESLSYYASLTDCIGMNMAASIKLSVTDNKVAQPSAWFTGDSYKTGNVYPAGEIACADIAKKAMALWGWGSDYVQFLSDIGYTYNPKTTTWNQGSGDTSKRNPNFQAAVKGRVYNNFTSSLPPLTNAAKYIEAYHFFFATSSLDVPACSAQSLGAYPELGGVIGYKDIVDAKKVVSVDDPSFGNPAIKKIVPNEPSIYIRYNKASIVDKITRTAIPPQGVVYIYGTDTSPDSFLPVKVYSIQAYGTQKTQSCDQILSDINSNAIAYTSWLVLNPDAKPPDNKSYKEIPTEKTTSCVIDGIGWIVCSTANFVAKATDGIYGLIQNLLKIPIINTDIKGGGDGVYNTWAIMRNFANIAFVIGFLIIIFSQLTSLGVTNYGVKKTLPRLIVAAVLVNISFWIGAIAVDLSNVAGAGIYDVMGNVKGGMNISLNNNWGNILTGLLGGTAITVAAGVVTAAAAGALVASGAGLSILFLVLPLVLSALLAVFVAAFILIARQALVVILIIVSPLAFVALLLPNTEKLFGKWRSALVSVLLMYPIISLVFGGAQIAGLAIMSTASTGADPALPIVIGQTVMVIPFFFLPTLIMKFSGNNLSGFASNIMKKGQGLIGGINAKARKEGMSRLGRGVNMMKYGSTEPKNRVGRRVRSAGRWLDKIKDGQAITDGYVQEKRLEESRKLLGTMGPDGKIEASDFTIKAVGKDKNAADIVASRAIASGEAEELKKALQPLIRELAGMDPDAKTAHLKSEIDTGGAARSSAALHYAASVGNTELLRKYTEGNDDHARQANEAIQANAGVIMAKAPDLVKGRKLAFSSPKAAEIATWDAETANKFMEHVKTMAPDSQKTAMDSFDVAMDVITKSPDLQSKLGVNTTKAFLSYAEDPVLKNMAGLGAIREDGSVR